MTGQSYWFFSKWGSEERQNFSRLLSTKVRCKWDESSSWVSKTNKQTPRLQWWPHTPGLWVFWFGFESSWSPCSWDGDQKLSRSTYLVTLSLTHVRGVWGFICSSEGWEMEGTLGETETLRTETWAFPPRTQGPGAGSQVPPSQGASGEDWGLGNWYLPGASLPSGLGSLIRDKPWNPKSSSLPATTEPDWNAVLQVPVLPSPQLWRGPPLSTVC